MKRLSDERTEACVVSEAMSQSYETDAQTRQEIDALPGSVVVEFGANWCGICTAAQPSIRAAFADYPGVRHIKIEDGPGRPTGRSFGVKLWPTLVFLNDGMEVARVVRPSDAQSVSRALAELAASSQSDG